MKHQQLAPSIHSDEVNPHIEFRESPFYLQHGLSEWVSSSPRRALINSFGAGGVNACLIVEEYVNAGLPQDARTSGPCVFTVSAKNEERLREYVNRLLVHLRGARAPDLASLCYSLQTGREAMEERLALVVSTLDELIDRLGEWSGRRSSADIYRGSPGTRRAPLRSSKAGEAAAGEQRIIDLASRWVAGEAVDWESFYSGTKPRRIGLPTYPFARDRYWITDSPISEKRTHSNARLHPLISYNSSTLREVSFSSSLLDNAFYAVDHRVNGQRIFPGAGFLEVACISGNIAGEQRVRKIKDVVWIQPLIFRTGTQTLRTSLKQIGDSVDYTISSADAENEWIVHSEGRMFFSDDWTKSAAAHADAEDRIPIQSLKEQGVRHEEAAAFYRKFSDYGLQYGHSFQTIQEIYVNSSFALSRLKIPSHLKEDFGEFILHPSMIDGALQTIAALSGGARLTSLHLPFALDEVDIVHPVPQTCYAFAECADSQMQNHAGVRKFNLRILGERGEVLIAFKNLYVRPLSEPLTVSRSGVAKDSAANGNLLSLAMDSVDLCNNT